MTAPPVPYRVEPAGPEAADALARIHARAFPAPWDAAGIAAQLASPFTFALAAMDRSDAPVGFILVRAVAREAEVLTLAVVPEARQRGIGAALVEGAAGLATAAGASAVWLEVAEDNPTALALYRAAGFQPQGRRRGYYAREAGPFVDALVLRRLLNTAPA